MDNSGKNRYELLFMDDDVSDPLDNVVRKKVKQQPTASAGTTTSTNTSGRVGAANTHASNQKQNNKQNTSNSTDNSNQNSNKQNQQKKSTSSSANQIINPAEKENKSLTINKSFERKSQNTSQSGLPANRQKFGQVNKDQQGYRNRDNNQDNQRVTREGGNRNVNFRQANGETREQRNNRRNRDDRPQQNGSTVAQNSSAGDYNNDQQHRPQRQNRDNRDNRGPPRNRGGNYEGGRGKREFDRQSGSDKTGVKAIDKRDGAGAHNWGSVKQDIEDINKSTEETGLTDKDEATNDQTAEQNTTAIEEETKELTLDEWKAQRQQRAKPQFNIRKAGEGEDLSQWKKMVALNNKKKVSVDDDSEEELEYDPSMYPQRVGRLQRVLDIQFNFNDGRRPVGMGRNRGNRGQRGQIGNGPRQGGGDRPERGGGGGGGNGGDRGDRGDRPERVDRGGDRQERGGAGSDRPERGGGGGGGSGGGGGGGGSGGGERRQRFDRPRGGGERYQRGGHGQHAPKVDDERQFPTLS